MNVDIEVLAARAPDSSAIRVFIVNHQIVNQTAVNKSIATNVALRLQGVSNLPTVTLRRLDNSIVTGGANGNLTAGPTLLTLPAGVSASIDFTGYGVALLEFKPTDLMRTTATPTSSPTVSPTRTPTRTATSTAMITSSIDTSTSTVTAMSTATNTVAAISTVTSTAISTVAATSTATATPTGTSGLGLFIYRDALTAPWYDQSYLSTVSYTNTTSVFAGARSIKFIAGANGGLDLHNDSGVQTAPYRYLQFAARATQSGQQFSVYLADATSNNNALGQHVRLSDYGGSPPVGTWSTYVIPLADMNGSNKLIGEIVIEDASGTSQQALYIDELQLRP